VSLAAVRVPAIGYSQLICISDDESAKTRSWSKLKDSATFGVEWLKYRAKVCDSGVMYMFRIQQIVDKPNAYWGKAYLNLADRMVRLDRQRMDFCTYFCSLLVSTGTSSETPSSTGHAGSWRHGRVAPNTSRPGNRVPRSTSPTPRLALHLACCRESQTPCSTLAMLKCRNSCPTELSGRCSRARHDLLHPL
jgi:hypothetical protein